MNNYCGLRLNYPIKDSDLLYFISSAHHVLCYKIFFKKPGIFSSLCSFPNKENERNSLVEVKEVLSFSTSTIEDLIIDIL